MKTDAGGRKSEKRAKSEDVTFFRGGRKVDFIEMKMHPDHSGS